MTRKNREICESKTTGFKTKVDSFMVHWKLLLSEMLCEMGLVFLGFNLLIKRKFLTVLKCLGLGYFRNFISSWKLNFQLEIICQIIIITE